MAQRSDVVRERDFGVWLRQARTELDLTQEALAELAGCSVQTVRSFESGRRRPSRDMAGRLADVLQVPLTERDMFVRVARAPLGSHLVHDGPDARASAVPVQPRVGPRLSVPLPPEALIGRHADLLRLREALLTDGRRLVTVLGPGGIGKTRIALQVAADLAPHFDDSAVFVPLAAATNPADVITTIMETVGAPPPVAQPPERVLLAFLRERAMLLVLDNLEHLLSPEHADRISALLTNILREAPEVTVLCTSRERLRLRAEAVIEIDGLGLPSDEQPGTIERAEATLLFLERARQAADTFALTSENRAAVAQLCRLLGGAPLGIELAATWVRVMSCAEIADEMSRSIDFLARDDRDLPARHRSLRAVIEHSWQLLTADEQRILQRLSVFRGGFRREAAAAVCVDGQPGDGASVPRPTSALLPALSALVDKSLLRRTPDYDGSTRYDIHEVVRQYLTTRRAVDPAAETAERLHAVYYAAWLAGQNDILKSARQSEALRAITAEMGNIRAMWRWATDHQDATLLRQAFETLQWFYEVSGWNTEAATMSGAGAAALRSLAEDRTAADAIRSTYWLLVTLEGWYLSRSDPVAGVPRLYAGLEGQRTTHDRWALALSLLTVGYVQIFVGQFASAQAMLEESVALSLEDGYTWILGVDKVVRGMLETLRSDPETARSYLHDALVTARAIGDPRLISLALNYLGLAALSLGQTGEAERVCQEALPIAQQHQDNYQASLALQSLGRVALARGAYPEAEALINHGLAIAREMSDSWLEAQALGYLGQLAGTRGDLANARAHRRAALSAAGSAPQPIALDALAALADLELDTQTDASLAALAYVRHHPLSRPAVRAIAEQRWRDVWRQLPAERCLAAETAAKFFPSDQPAALLALFGHPLGIR